jgi:outer membrane murein-binding lipoprotein Lpp
MKKLKVFCIFAAVVTAMMFGGCESNEKETGIVLQTQEAQNVSQLNALLANVRSGNMEYTGKYMEKWQKVCMSENSSLKPRRGVSAKGVQTLSETQKIVQEEYLARYVPAIEELSENNSDTHVLDQLHTLSTNIDYSEFINDSRLSLEEREFLVLSLVSLERTLVNFRLDYNPLEPGNERVAACVKTYRAECWDILFDAFGSIYAAWYFFFSGDWASSGSTLAVILNNEYRNRLDAATNRYDNCLANA